MKDGMDENSRGKQEFQNSGRWGEGTENKVPLSYGITPANPRI